MALEIRQAFSKMKQARNHALHFFFCEKGEDGKPVLLIDTKKIPSTVRSEALAKAQKKGKCAGTMEMDDKGELNVTPKGQAPSSLKMGLQIVARSKNCMPAAININPAQPEEPEDDGTTSADTGEAPPPPTEVPPEPTADELLLRQRLDGLREQYERALGSLTESKAKALQALWTTAEEAGQRREFGTGLGILNRLKPFLDIAAHVQNVQAKKDGAPQAFHPTVEDAFTNDPQLRELIDQRTKLEGELYGKELQEEVHKLTDPKERETRLKAHQEAVVRLNQAISNRMAELSLSVRHLGEEYVGEDKKHGIARLGLIPPVREPRETPEEFERRRQAYQQAVEQHRARVESKTRVTKYFTDEERKDATVRVDAQGRLVDSQGKPLQKSQDLFGYGYALDKQGNMYKFLGKDRTGPGVVSPTGGRVTQTIHEHHSSVLAGEETAGAGRFNVNDEGRLEEIDNVSGHYKPGVAQMIQVVEQLLRNGALLDTELVGPQGEPVDAASPAGKLYARVMDIQNGLMQKLADDPTANVTDDLRKIGRVKAQLAKLGYSPSNRMSDTVVKFLSIKPDDTGHKILFEKQAEVVMQVGDFLKTGAGNQSQAKLKSELLGELETKLRARKDGLDAEAEERAGKYGAEGTASTRSLDELAAELDSPELQLKKDRFDKLLPGEKLDELKERPDLFATLKIGYSMEEELSSKFDQLGLNAPTLLNMKREAHETREPWDMCALAYKLNLTHSQLFAKLFGDLPGLGEDNSRPTPETPLLAEKQLIEERLGFPLKSLRKVEKKFGKKKFKRAWQLDMIEKKCGVDRDQLRDWIGKDLDFKALAEKLGITSGELCQKLFGEYLPPEDGIPNNSTSSYTPTTDGNPYSGYTPTEVDDNPYNPNTPTTTDVDPDDSTVDDSDVDSDVDSDDD